MKLRLLSLFSGVGAFEMALKELGIEVDLVNYCEIDKYPSKSYAAIHGVSESMNLGDITKIDIESLPSDIDMITHGSPCQDFSVAGLGAGGDEGSGTRSSLMWNTVKIVKHCKPKYVIWENVKSVLDKKNKHNYDKYIRVLSEIGYKSYGKVLNAKNFGIPQNRERIYVVSCLDDEPFVFPKEKESMTPLKSILETEVDEKYYLSADKVEKLVNQIIEKQGNKGIGALIKQATSTGSIYCQNEGLLNCGYPNSETRRGRVVDGGEVSGTLECGNHIGKLEIQQLGQMYGTEKEPNPHAGRIYDSNGLSPSVSTCQGGNRMPIIAEINQIPIDEQNLAVRQDTIGTLTTDGSSPKHNNRICEIKQVGLLNEKRHASTMNSVLNTAGICSCLDTMQGGNREPKIIDVQMLGNVNPSNKGQNGTVIHENGLARTVTVEKGEGQKVMTVHPIITPDREEKRQNGRRLKEDGEPMFSLTTQDRHGVLIATTDRYNYMVRIRKLTPLECWRLMAFKDSDFYKAQGAGISNSQLYKQAGNSIVVSVLVEIFRSLFKITERENE